MPIKQHMAERLRKFIPRAPRYVLRPSDEKFLRYAHHDERNRSFTTQIINLSETGIAFLVERESAPALGDVIKIEFPIPGGEQVAWFARVVRMEEFAPEEWGLNPRRLSGDEVMVGIHFLDMPEGHRQSIRKGLEAKFLELLRAQRQESLRAFWRFFLSHYGKVLVYLICAIATFSILYYLSLPSGNYDAKRGAPWGERFKF